MKRIVVMALLSYFFITTLASASVCPAPSLNEILSKKSAQYGMTYVGYLQGKPHLMLQTDFEHDGSPQKFYSMMLTPISPYFVSCSYNRGDIILKTSKQYFYDTNKHCQLVASKPAQVQVSPIASICYARHVSDCQIVCH